MKPVSTKPSAGRVAQSGVAGRDQTFTTRIRTASTGMKHNFATDTETNIQLEDL